MKEYQELVVYCKVCNLISYQIDTRSCYFCGGFKIAYLPLVEKQWENFQFNVTIWNDYIKHGGNPQQKDLLKLAKRLWSLKTDV